jgi:hypothetical protein
MRLITIARTQKILFSAFKALTTEISFPTFLDSYSQISFANVLFFNLQRGIYHASPYFHIDSVALVFLISILIW